jgi:alpha-glucoside transport system substrate-binding protein
MLLALQSLDTSAAAGIPAVVEAEEALHWALQAARVPYPTTDAPVEVRTGPHGPAGVYRLPLAQLIDLARGHLGRSFTPDECTRYAIEPCPGQDRSSGWPAVPRDPVRPELQPAAERPLAGTSITVIGCCDPDTGLEDEFARFEERTGIDIVHGLNPSVTELEVATAAARGEPPDLAIWGQPGAIAAFAEAGQLIDLSAYLDEAAARRQVGDHLVDVASVGSGWFAVPVELNLKGLIWYPVPEFEQAGYAIPSTWDELVALSQQMVADGRTPWCLGLEAENVSGWPATDWIEALVLRLGGVDLYDRWADGEIPFDHPVIRQAAAMFGQIAFGEGFVSGGPGSISRRSFSDADDPMFSDPPGCWLHHQATFVREFLPAGAQAGTDVDYFVMPPIHPGGDTPVLGGAGMASAFTDRPEVREFLRWVLSPEWGTAWADNPDPGSSYLPHNAGFDVTRCRAADVPEAENAVRVRLCEEARDAVAAGQWRFDASDLMPPDVGNVTSSGSPGTFLQGMTDYVDRGPESLDGILADIDGARHR